MKAISKNLIEAISTSDYNDFADEIEKKVNNLIANAVEDLSRSLPFINLSNCVLQPANETFTGAITPESEYVYLLGVQSPQIEMNSLHYNDSWRKFKEQFAYAWKSTKRKKRRKKRGQDAQKEISYETADEKYNTESLKVDLQKAIAKYLSPTSIIYGLDRSLKIVGRDDFGPKTQIYIFPCIMEGENFKFLISRKKGFYSINFTNRIKLINEKMEAVGEKYITILKILNSLYRSTKYASAPNQPFLESLLYNVPNELYEGDNIYDVFIKIINYLNLTDVSQLKSIINPNLTVGQDKATKGNQYAFIRFLNSIETI